MSLPRRDRKQTARRLLRNEGRHDAVRCGAAGAGDGRREMEMGGMHMAG